MMKTTLCVVIALAACSKHEAPKPAESAKPAEQPTVPAPSVPVDAAIAAPTKPAEPAVAAQPDGPYFTIAYDKKGQRIIPLGCNSHVGNGLLIMVAREKAKDPCDFAPEDDYDLAFQLSPTAAFPDVGYTTKTELEIDLPKHAVKIPATVKVASKDAKNMWLVITPDGALPKGVTSVGGSMRIELEGHDAAEPVHTWQKTDANKRPD